MVSHAVDEPMQSEMRWIYVRIILERASILGLDEFFGFKLIDPIMCSVFPCRHSNKLDNVFYPFSDPSSFFV